MTSPLTHAYLHARVGGAMAAVSGAGLDACPFAAAGGPALRAWAEGYAGQAVLAHRDDGMAAAVFHVKRQGRDKTPWSALDLAVLRAAAPSGIGAAAIGALLARGAGAVTVKACKAGVSLRSSIRACGPTQNERAETVGAAPEAARGETVGAGLRPARTSGDERPSIRACGPTQDERGETVGAGPGPARTSGDERA